MNTPRIKRKEFITRLMQNCGLTYDQACCAYSTFVGVVEYAVVNGAKVGFGRVGNLVPVKKPPRDVTMGFERKPGNRVVRKKRTFHLDERTDWIFKLHGEFQRRHHLR